ncbi:collagen alpha-1(I) chain-like [Talpa occidentalis]|uniref:collagen alpha-1(I) chain-like n=1 Tax=Talpa occidentalis TaxID=50954 RepID=UPI00188EA0FD|nr:collagen alpha-1(I) chain-like [Talpa occidentalis]
MNFNSRKAEGAQLLDGAGAQARAGVRGGGGSAATPADCVTVNTWGPRAAAPSPLRRRALQARGARGRGARSEPRVWAPLARRPRPSGLGSFGRPARPRQPPSFPAAGAGRGARALGAARASDPRREGLGGGPCRGARGPRRRPGRSSGGAGREGPAPARGRRGCGDRGAPVRGAGGPHPPAPGAGPAGRARKGEPRTGGRRRVPGAEEGPARGFGLVAGECPGNVLEPGRAAPPSAERRLRAGLEAGLGANGTRGAAPGQGPAPDPAPPPRQAPLRGPAPGPGALTRRPSWHSARSWAGTGEPGSGRADLAARTTEQMPRGGAGEEQAEEPERRPAARAGGLCPARGVGGGWQVAAAQVSLAGPGWATCPGQLGRETCRARPEGKTETVLKSYPELQDGDTPQRASGDTPSFMSVQPCFCDTAAVDGLGGHLGQKPVTLTDRPIPKAR